MEVMASSKAKSFLVGFLVSVGIKIYACMKLSMIMKDVTTYNSINLHEQQVND